MFIRTHVRYIGRALRVCECVYLRAYLLPHPEYVPCIYMDGYRRSCKQRVVVVRLPTTLLRLLPTLLLLLQVVVVLLRLRLVLLFLSQLAFSLLY